MFLIEHVDDIQLDVLAEPVDFLRLDAHLVCIVIAAHAQCAKVGVIRQAVLAMQLELRMIGIIGILLAAIDLQVIAVDVNLKVSTRENMNLF